MINREERRARIKTQIAKAVSEIDHGDPAAAVLALADGLNAMLHYVESGEMALAARLELCQIKLQEFHAELASLSVLLQQGIHPMGEEVKEAQPMARTKVTKR
jgi:hypothetical protein